MASGTAARGRAGGRAGRMLRCLGSLAVGTGGAAALEFAFAAIILLSLTMGVIDIGRAMHTMNTLEHAVKEGSRYASIHGSQSADPRTDQEIGDFIRDRFVGVDPAGATIQVQWTPNDNPGSTVAISITYPFTFLFATVFTTTPYNFISRSTGIVGR